MSNRVDTILYYGFKQIVADFGRRGPKDKGKNLDESNHVYNCKEVGPADGPTIITAEVLRTTAPKQRHDVTLEVITTME